MKSIVAGKNIFADAFDDVSVRLADFSGFHEFVVERADRIDADNFYFGIFFLQVPAHAADRTARAHAANEMRDFAFGIFPNFRAGGAVMRFGIHRIFVLIGIKGIGNFTREFFRDGIIAARIVGLDGRGADDHFGAERLQQVHFFLAIACR